ncbi:MAG: HAD-IA family hydrolase [Propionibacteriaceae bacterium]|jgi:putative hydrolase of the HAD superfamily|nr:HAD-IA family hydrolase [Propionibacteriaceae bacterium]
MAIEVVALDAMGVIYEAADDVSHLLLPYLRSKGCESSPNEINRLYRACSLGQFSSAEFWRRCGVSGSDAEYCSHHAMTPGMREFICDCQALGLTVAVISNDVSEWSRLLRQRFALDALIASWTISGDVGSRKPDKAIFDKALRSLGVPPRNVFFFDDRPANVASANRLGFRSALFTDAESSSRLLRSELSHDNPP